MEKSVTTSKKRWAWGYTPQDGKIKDWFVKIVGHPHPYGRVRADNVMSLIKPGLKTLDVGCGEGVFSRELSLRGMEVVGLDIDPEAIDSSAENQKRLEINYQTLVGDAQKLPLENESFDQIISTDVLEHVEDPLKAIKEIRRVIKTTGQFIATVPTPLYLTKPILKNVDFSEHLVKIGHTHAGWFLKEFTELLDQAGFRVVEHRYYGHFPIRLIMELAFIKMGPKNVSEERKCLYSLGWSTLLQYTAILPAIWMDRFFSKNKKAALLAVRAVPVEPE